VLISPAPSILAQRVRELALVKQDNNNLEDALSTPLILVVDNEAGMRQLVHDTMRQAGLACIGAASVAEALAALKAHRIALTVLDWRMDDGCGDRVLHEARLHYPQMPVLVMSGQPYDVRTDAIVGQADAFLDKPLSGVVLQIQVMQLLKRAQRFSQLLFPEVPEDIRLLSEIKDTYIRHAVRLLNGNVSLAAERLGIHRQTVAGALKPERSVSNALGSQPCPEEGLLSWSC
jgi:DNA-binding NtrC family response regulator